MSHWVHPAFTRLLADENTCEVAGMIYFILLLRKNLICSRKSTEVFTCFAPEVIISNNNGPIGSV